MSVLENISLQVESADLIMARLRGGLQRFESGSESYKTPSYKMGSRVFSLQVNSSGF